MSLCYDFQKWTIMTLSAILTVCLVGLVNLVYGQEYDDRNYTKDLTQGRHVDELGIKIGLISDECGRAIDNNDTSIIAPCVEFVKNLDKALTTAFNRSSSAIEKIQDHAAQSQDTGPVNQVSD